jgi:hypothetical protein
VFFKLMLTNFKCSETEALRSRKSFNTTCIISVMVSFLPEDKLEVIYFLKSLAYDSIELFSEL